jgi:hypothetical protein
MKANLDKNLESQRPVKSSKEVDPYKRIAGFYERIFEPLFKNYRDFMAAKGLRGSIFAHGLSVDKEKVVSGGNIALLLLRIE